MRLINNEEYWETLERHPQESELIYTAFAHMDEGFDSVEAFEQFSKEILTPASIVAARLNGCQSDELALFYDEIVVLSKLIAGGDPSQLNLDDEKSHQFYRQRVALLEEEARSNRRCHPESGYFVCYCQ